MLMQTPNLGQERARAPSGARLPQAGAHTHALARGAAACGGFGPGQLASA